MDDECDEAMCRIIFNKLKKISPLIDGVTLGPESIKTTNKQDVPVPPEIPTTPMKKISPTYTYPDILRNKFGKIVESERKYKVESAIQARLQKFKEFEKVQEEQSKESQLRIKRTIIDDVERQEKMVLEVAEQCEKNQAVIEAKLMQFKQDAMQRMRQRRELLNERERKKEKLMENVNKIKLNHQKFVSEYHQIPILMKSCVASAELKNSRELDLSLLKYLPAEMDAVLSKCKGENVFSVTEQNVQKSNEVLERMITFKNQFKNAVEGINARKQAQLVQIEEQKKYMKQQEEEQNRLKLETKTETHSPTNENSYLSESSKPTSESLNMLSKCVSIADLRNYTELMTFIDNYTKSFSELENDSNLKTFKFDCKKAVNIPLNSLSGVNAEHIMDKYIKLHRLLSGQTVIISGKQVNATQHPQGVFFCTNLLAKKFVLQGDLMVSSNPESSFCYASVILSLWNEFPDFGRLLMGYFYEMCPYLVPYYIPKEVGQSDEQFYKKLGYQYSDGEVEKQDKFLKRMTGIMRLYFTLMIAKPKRGQPSSPFNLKNGWKWLVSFLKLEPQLDITATALQVFLETVGFEMDRRYGKKFQKILTLIIQIFLPKCKDVKCTGGALTRVELLLTDYLSKNRFKTPSGFTEYPSW